MTEIKYPYLPRGHTIVYVAQRNRYMQMARRLAKKYRSNLLQPGGAVLVKDGAVIGRGSIGNNAVHRAGCERVRLNMPTGHGYELCDGCNPKFHSERQAIELARKKGFATSGGDLYLWGHWWCCESCWRAMLRAEIRTVYLLAGSERLFNRSHPDNILGRQFD